MSARSAKPRSICSSPTWPPVDDLLQEEVQVRVVVTGASGFLGKRVAASLTERGEDVTLLARSTSVLPSGAGQVVRFEHAVEAGELVAAMAPDVLIHMAAAQGRRGESAATMVDANVTLSAALLGAMGPGSLFINTGTTLPPHMNLYALTKSQFVELARHLVTQGRTDAHVVNTQFQMIYGPADDPAKFVPKLALQLVENAGPLVTTPGTQRRDFIYVDDAVAAILAIVDARTQLPTWQEVPIGTGIAVPLCDFIERAITVSGFNQPWQKSLSPRAGEPEEMVADITILQSLGWASRTSLDDGIGRLIDDARATVSSGRT
ncbi:NAD-dependent epimerase/dehydratase [Rhizobium sp. Leaf321]|uniref:NAD-dependent epimerase/dehydratase family protein n=1 Tax=Rhizobium sp. Leaf321 TaxID=1736335 RepID=UPI0009EAAEEA|nr:NAD-dependent epimerase/dehydratase [Rhizobium sp. Leaf321]